MIAAPPWPVAAADALVASNVLHYSPWQTQPALFGGFAFDNFQQIGAAAQIGELFHAQTGHQFAHVLSDKFKVIHRFFGQAVVMLAAQSVVLGGHACGAVVQVTNAQIATAQSHHRAGTKTKTFSTQNRGFDDVQTCFQAAIAL